MAPMVDDPSIRPHDSIARLMTAEAVSVDEAMTLRNVAGVLARAGIGAALVERRGRTVGIVSERDLVWALADGADADAEWSADVMSRDLVTADADDSILATAFRMIDGRVRHLAITRDDQIVGVVSSRDVFAVLAEDTLAAG